MSFTTRCPSCRETLDVDEEHRGWTVRCPSCDDEFVAGGEPRRRPRRRRYRYDEPDDDEVIEWAEDDVRTPALFVKIFGWIGIAIGVLGVFVFVLLLLLGGNNNRRKPAAPFNDEELVLRVTQSAMTATLGVLTVIGGVKMGRLESRGWAITSAILAMIPCINWCCLLGIPLGIWVLVVLNRPDVTDGFALVARSRYRRRFRGYDDEDEYDD
jgi:hypothetical protein